MFTKKNKFGCYGITLALLAQLGCQGDNPASATKTETHRTRHADLGWGYNKESDNFVANQCIDVGKDTETEIVSNDQPSKIYVGSDSSMSDILQTVDGSLKTAISVGAFSLSAGVGIANSHVANDYSITRTVVLNLKNKTKRFKNIGQLKLSDEGLAAQATQDPNYAKEKCGNQFVTEIDLGATFLATLKLEFQNIEDRNRFEGNMKTSLLGIGSIEGGLTKQDNDTNKKVKVSFSYEQIGGDQSLFSSVIAPKEVADCVGGNVGQCLLAYEAALHYAEAFGCQVSQNRILKTTKNAKTEAAKEEKFDCATVDSASAEKMKQYADRALQNFSAVSYGVSSYSEQTKLDIKPASLEANQLAVLKTQQEKAQEGFYKALGLANRAHVILSTFARDLNKEAKTRVENARDLAIEQLRNYSSALDLCTDSNASLAADFGTKCQTELTKATTYAAAHPIDEADFAVRMESFQHWCEMYKKWNDGRTSTDAAAKEAANWILSEDEADSVRVVANAIQTDVIKFPASPDSPTCRELGKKALSMTTLSLPVNNDLKSLGSITTFPYLSQLFIRGAPIDDGSPISALRYLEEVDVSETKITNIDFLSKLVYLETVNAKGTRIPSIGGFLAERQSPKVRKVQISRRFMTAATVDAECKNAIVECN